MANYFDVNAAIRTPNIAGNIQQGMQFGQQQRALQEQREQERQKREREAQVRTLAPQVVSGDPNAYSQAAAIDPEAAGKYQAAGDAQLRRLQGAVNYFDNARKSNNPAAVQAAFQQIKPFLASLTGQQAPEAYDEATMGPAFEQVRARLAMLPPDTKGMPSGYREFQLSAQAAGLQPGTPEYEKAAKVALGLEGRASSAGFGFTKITGADGRERLARQNPRTGAAEVYNEVTGDFESMGGASPAAQPQTWAQPGATYQTPSGIVRIDPNIDPAGLEAAQADIAGGAQSDNIRLPDRAAQQGRGSLFVSQTPDEKAYATEAGKQRATLDFAGQTAEADANAARLKKEAEAQAERDAIVATKAQDASGTLALLDEAERILPNATGSGAGAAYDAAAGYFGKSTPGAQATAQLQTIAGQLTSKMPRMQGPQSDRDVELYKQMAGDLANASLPVATRMAALQTIRVLNEKYAAPAQQQRTAPSSRSQVKRYNPETGRLE